MLKHIVETCIEVGRLPTMNVGGKKSSRWRMSEVKIFLATKVGRFYQHESCKIIKCYEGGESVWKVNVGWILKDTTMSAGLMALRGEDQWISGMHNNAKTECMMSLGLITASDVLTCPSTWAGKHVWGEEWIFPNSNGATAFRMDELLHDSWMTREYSSSAGPLCTV